MNAYGHFIPNGIYFGGSSCDDDYDADRLIGGFGNLGISSARSLFPQEASQRNKNSSKGSKKKNSIKLADPQYDDADLWHNCSKGSDSDLSGMNRGFGNPQEKKKKNSLKAMSQNALETDYDPVFWDPVTVQDSEDVKECVQRAYMDGVADGVRRERIEQTKKKKNSIKAAENDFYVDTMAEQGYQTSKKKNSIKSGNPQYMDPWSTGTIPGYPPRYGPRSYYDYIDPPPPPRHLLLPPPRYGPSSMMRRGVPRGFPSRGRAPPGLYQSRLIQQPQWGSMYW